MKRIFAIIALGVVLSFLGINREKAFAQMHAYFRDMNHKLNNGYGPFGSPSAISSKPVVHLAHSGYNHHVFVIGPNGVYKFDMEPNLVIPIGVRNLGGEMDRVAVGMEQDGRLHVFGRKLNGKLYHIWETTPGGSWSSWVLLDDRWVESFVVSRNSDGRLELFGIAKNNALLHKWELSANGNTWSTWASLGGSINQLEEGQNADGRLEVFARWTDGSVRHIWQTTPGGSWSSWSSLGGWVEQLAVGRNADGRLEVFGIGTDHALHHIWQMSGGGWSYWHSLGGWIDTLAVDRDHSLSYSGLKVYARGLNSTLCTISQVSGGWNSWYCNPSAVLDDKALTAIGDYSDPIN